MTFIKVTLLVVHVNNVGIRMYAHINWIFNMKLVKSMLHIDKEKEFNVLKNSIDKRTISDINCPSNIYRGQLNFLYEAGIIKSNKPVETLVSRIIGNIVPHTDSNLKEYKRGVYLLVLDVSTSNNYEDSQDLPLMFNAGNFISIRKGDLILFNQYLEHALFWDKRIDIATFWMPR